MSETSANGHMTTIGPDTTIVGEMRFEKTARILGRFEGKVATNGELQVGQGACCKAAVEAGTLIVDGTIEGDIIAHQRVQLNSDAFVDGDIVAEKLIVAEGASFSGHCKVGPEAVKAATSQSGTSSPTGAAAPEMPEVHTRKEQVEAMVESKATQSNKFDWVAQPVGKTSPWNTPKDSLTTDDKEVGTSAEGAA